MPAGRRAVRPSLRVGEAAQDGEPATDGVAARAQPLVRQRLPRGEVRDGVGRQEAAQRVREVLGLAAGGGDREHRPRGAGGLRGGERGDQRRPQPGRTGDVELGVPALAGSRDQRGDRGVAGEDVENSREAHGSVSSGTCVVQKDGGDGTQSRAQSRQHRAQRRPSRDSAAVIMQGVHDHRVRRAQGVQTVHDHRLSAAPAVHSVHDHQRGLAEHHCSPAPPTWQHGGSPAP